MYLICVIFNKCYFHGAFHSIENHIIRSVTRRKNDTPCILMYRIFLYYTWLPSPLTFLCYIHSILTYVVWDSFDDNLTISFSPEQTPFKLCRARGRQVYIGENKITILNLESLCSQVDFKFRV